MRRRKKIRKTGQKQTRYNNCEESTLQNMRDVVQLYVLAPPYVFALPPAHFMLGRYADALPKLHQEES